MLYVAVAGTSSDNNILCTSGFVDNFVFSNNGANGPEPKMTRMFCRVHQIMAPVGRQRLS